MTPKLDVGVVNTQLDATLRGARASQPLSIGRVKGTGSVGMLVGEDVNPHAPGSRTSNHIACVATSPGLNRSDHSSETACSSRRVKEDASPGRRTIRNTEALEVARSPIEDFNACIRRQIDAHEVQGESLEAPVVQPEQLLGVQITRIHHRTLTRNPVVRRRTRGRRLSPRSPRIQARGRRLSPRSPRIQARGRRLSPRSPRIQARGRGLSPRSPRQHPPRHDE